MALSENFEQELLEAYKQDATIGTISNKMGKLGKEISNRIVEIKDKISKKFNISIEDPMFSISDETWEFKNKIDEKYLEDEDINKLYLEYNELLNEKHQYNYPNEFICTFHQIYYTFKIKETIDEMVKEFGETKADFIKLKIKRELYKFEKEQGIDYYTTYVKNQIKLADENIMSLENDAGEDEDYYKVGGVDYKGDYYIFLKELEDKDDELEKAHIFKVEKKGKKETFVKQLDIEINIEVFNEYKKSLREQNN